MTGRSLLHASAAGLLTRFRLRLILDRSLSNTSPERSADTRSSNSPSSSPFSFALRALRSFSRCSFNWYKQDKTKWVWSRAVPHLWETGSAHAASLQDTWNWRWEGLPVMLCCGYQAPLAQWVNTAASHRGHHPHPGHRCPTGIPVPSQSTWGEGNWCLSVRVAVLAPCHQPASVSPGFHTSLYRVGTWVDVSHF